jgi:hypothetical protein
MEGTTCRSVQEPWRARCWGRHGGKGKDSEGAGVVQGWFPQVGSVTEIVIRLLGAYLTWLLSTSFGTVDLTC